MTPEELKTLRDELQCTAKELAAALGVEQDTVLGWERGEVFPTKRFITQMEVLRKKGKAAFPRQARRNAPKTNPMAVLADPEMWKLVRKLLAHPTLRREAQKLAETYSDPAEEPNTD